MAGTNSSPSTPTAAIDLPRADRPVSEALTSPSRPTAVLQIAQFNATKATFKARVRPQRRTRQVHGAVAASVTSAYATFDTSTKSASEASAIARHICARPFPDVHSGVIHWIIVATD